MQKPPEKEVERYLRHGEHDELFGAWPGEDLFARARHGDAALRRRGGPTPRVSAYA